MINLYHHLFWITSYYTLTIAFNYLKSKEFIIVLLIKTLKKLLKVRVKELSLQNSFWIIQFSSVAQSCPTLCNTMNNSTPGFAVPHQFPEFTQSYVHWVSDAIHPSHPLLSPSPPALNLSQHQGLFKWVSSSHQVAKALELQLQHQSFQWTPRTNLL